MKDLFRATSLGTSSCTIHFHGSQRAINYIDSNLVGIGKQILDHMQQGFSILIWDPGIQFGLLGTNNLRKGGL